MVRFRPSNKTFCLYVTWAKQDQIWAKNFCTPKNMDSRTPLVSTTMTCYLCAPSTGDLFIYLWRHVHAATPILTILGKILLATPENIHCCPTLQNILPTSTWPNLTREGNKRVG